MKAPIPILILVCFFMNLLSSQVTAQLKIEKGEEVKVYVRFGDKWVDGTVVDRKNKTYLVEYIDTFGRLEQESFHRSNIRTLYEYEGLDFGRMWADKSGKFEVEGSLMKIDGNKVVIIKKDLSEITVPLDKLSTKDANYIKKFNKLRTQDVKRGVIADRTPELPDIENFGRDGKYSTFVDSEIGRAQPLGQLPSFMKQFKQAGVGYDLIRRDQELIAVIPVGGPDQLVLMSFRERNPFNKGEFFQSQLYWVSLKKKKVTEFVSITHEDYALDYDPRHKLLLTFNRNDDFIDAKDEPSHYTLWRLEVGAGNAEPIARWRANGLGWAKSLFGKIVNQTMVVIRSNEHTYEGYDVAAKQMVYRLKPQSFFSPPVVISPDRKHLIVPEDGQVSVVDAENGDIIMTLPVDDRHVSGANVSPDGTKLVAITESNLYLWDLQTEFPEPTVYPAVLIASPFKSRIDFIGDDYILGETSKDRVLYKLSERLPVWSYVMDVRQYFDNRDPLKNMVVDGKLFYVAQHKGLFEGSVAVGAVNLPGPKVEETIQNIDRESLLLMKPGVKVKFRLTGISSRDGVEQVLREKVTENGWIVDESADIVIHAELGKGKSQSVDYQEMGINGKVTSVSFSPHYANIRIAQDEVIIFQSGTSNAAPAFLRGQNLQKAIKKYEVPQVGFFKNIKIPAEILHPRYSRGFGQSKLGLRGIEVVATAPPGREDDPAAATRQAEEDRRKAIEQARNSKQ